MWCSNVSAVLDGVADKDKESYLKFWWWHWFCKNLRTRLRSSFWPTSIFLLVLTVNIKPLQAICPVCNSAILRSSRVGWTCDYKIENFPSTTVQGEVILGWKPSWVTEHAMEYYARVLGRLSMRNFLGWFVLHTLRVKFMDFVMPA